MTTDRDLLELAAKAAGIKLLFCPNGFPRNCNGLDPNSNIFAATVWNPLTDDGDAFDLMVTLRLRPRYHLAGVTPTVTVESIVCECSEPLGSDENAATRLAIVRSAAEIGKAMAKAICEPAQEECHGCRMAEKHIKQLREENGKLAAPKREWVELSAEDLSVCDDDGVLLAKYWEAKLKELNHG